MPALQKLLRKALRDWGAAMPCINLSIYCVEASTQSSVKRGWVGTIAALGANKGYR